MIRSDVRAVVRCWLRNPTPANAPSNWYSRAVLVMRCSSRWSALP